MSGRPRLLQDAVDLPKMVQVVGRFQSGREILDRLPSAGPIVDSVALHPPGCAATAYANSRRLLSRSVRKTAAERLASCCA